MNYDFDDEPTITLQLALDSMNAEELRKLVALTGQKAPTRKGDMAALIVQHLAGERLRTVWDGLDELQQAAVAEAAHSPSSQFFSGQFRAKYGRDPDWVSEGKTTHDRKPTALCFFLYRNHVLPADLKARLLKFVPEPRQPAVATLDPLPPTYPRLFERWNQETRIRERGFEEVPLAVHETERAAQRELLSILRLADAGKIAVSDKTRRASAATIDAIGAILEGGDYYPQTPPTDEWCDSNTGPIRALAWPLLIQAGGLAQLAGPRLQLTKAGRKALSEPAAGTIRTLLTKWLNTTILDELARIECVKGQTGKGKRGLVAVSERRATIADGLAECPPGAWVTVDEFYRYMQATGDDLTVARDAWGLYIGEQQYGSLGYDGNERVLNMRYLLSLLHEYAATLGMIDLAVIPPAGARDDFHSLWGTDELPFFSRYGRSDVLPPHAPWGLLPGCESGLPAGAHRGEAGAPGAAEPGDRGNRARPGAERPSGAQRLRHPGFGLRLASGSQSTAGRHRGGQVAEIRAFLAARSGTTLPDTVARLLDDVAGRTTLLQDRGLARLIECADAALAALIANDTRTRKHCMRAGERHLVVTGSSDAAFRRALRDAGYLLAADSKRPAKSRDSTPRPVSE